MYTVCVENVFLYIDDIENTVWTKEITVGQSGPGSLNTMTHSVMVKGNWTAFIALF